MSEAEAAGAGAPSPGTAARPLVVFGLPAYRRIAPAAHFSLIGAVSWAVANGHACGFQCVEVGLADMARNKILEAVWESPTGGRADGTVQPITHILWIDDDMIVPKTIARDLLAHGKDVVGATYYKRTEPYEPVAYTAVSPLVPFDPPPGLHRVAGMGLGCTLVSMDVYRKMHAHFADGKFHHASFGEGEDVWFFKRCAEIGTEAFVDGSVVCGHVTDAVVKSRDGFTTS